MIKHVVSCSTGKDSVATLLLAIENCPRENIIPIFCDTGNEHEVVYQHLTYLEQALDITIVRLKADFTEQIANKRNFIARDQRKGRKYDTIKVPLGGIDENGKELFRLKKVGGGRRIRWSNKAKRRALAVLHPTGNPFLDLCLWKGRFPSRKAQFCTEELKRNMAVEFQLSLVDQGFQVLSWQGVRRDESESRKNAKKSERIGGGIWTFRPIVEWTALDTFAFAKARGIQPNPLYTAGMGRVGCMPCINARKDELLQISKRFPEHIQRIAKWESLVAQAGKRGVSPFFAAPKMTNREASKQTIGVVVEWSKTTRGGKQYDLLGDLAEPTACASSYGLCE